ncbi:tetratricopeptide repeat protein [Myxococcota bacterium]|nr:tetratricopeptide repeat protein [Myxococcota bacterium]MBU1410703.1 tetratricopeptide repeat protein [Myxococcota bacterium]MBU1509549.1 tetratricopeptide repeat protein [Myxococcota bacterium]
MRDQWMTFVMLCGITAASACGCQKQEPVRSPKPADVVGHKDPEPGMMTVVVPPGSMTADATPVVEAAPVPPPDPIETMTVPADPVEKAKLYYEMGYGAAAVQLLGALPAETLEKTGVQLLLGQAAELCGRNREAVAACTKAAAVTEAAPKTQALMCLARAYLGLKEHAKALRSLEAALEASPDDLIVRRATMDVLLGLKSRDALLKVVQETLAKAPGDPATMLYLGSAHELAKAREKAHETYEKLTGNDTIPAWVEAEAFDRMGMLWIKADPKKSREILARCRQRVPGAGCPRTELSLSPPDPRHPERRIRNVSRPGRYGETPLPPP